MTACLIKFKKLLIVLNNNNSFYILFVCLFVCCFLHSVYSFNITQIQSGVLYTVVVSTVAEGRSGATPVLASAPSVKTLIPSVFIVGIIQSHSQAPSGSL